MDGAGGRAALLPAEDQQERRADQHSHHPRLHRHPAVVALYRHERRERGVLPAERPDRGSLSADVYDDIGNDQQQKNKSHQAAYLHK